MAAFVPNWVGAGPGQFQSRNLMDVYTTGLIASYPGAPEPPYYWCEGIDQSLGCGGFIYAQMTNATGCNAGDVCEFTAATVSSGSSVSIQSGVQQWQGTANSGKSLCVALAAVALNQYGWFQVWGAALVNTASGGVASANASLYWNANGSVKTAAVASKQALGMSSLVVNSASFGQGVSGVTPALSATQCIAIINCPVAQSAIT